MEYLTVVYLVRIKLKYKNVNIQLQRNGQIERERNLIIEKCRKMENLIFWKIGNCRKLKMKKN